MSVAVIRFGDSPGMIYRCKSDSYPSGLGFDLLFLHDNGKSFIGYFSEHNDRFDIVGDEPKDVEYEYVIGEAGVSCRERWYTKSGGFKYGMSYDLRELKEKIRLQREYSYRREEAWR